MGTNLTVPAASMVCMAVTGLLTVLLPITLAIWAGRKGGQAVPLVTGAGTFILFAMVLEQLAHALVLGSGLGTVIRENLLFYALYGGLMAGVFEETGRLAAFRLVLRRRNSRANALMYGVGHGGVEAILITGLTMVNNLVLSVLLNTGTLEQTLGQLPESTMAAVMTLAQVAPTDFLWAGFERAVAIALHIALSILVYGSVTRRERRWMFPSAILAHGSVDALAVLSAGRLPVWGTELVVLALTVLVALSARRVWRRLGNEEKNTSLA